MSDEARVESNGHHPDFGDRSGVPGAVADAVDREHHFTLALEVRVDGFGRSRDHEKLIRAVRRALCTQIAPDVIVQPKYVRLHG